MRAISEAPWFCFVVALSIISMPLSDISANNDLDSVPNKIFQIGGGGGSLEEQCGSITFENMFEYSKAKTFQSRPGRASVEQKIVVMLPVS